MLRTFKMPLVIVRALLKNIVVKVVLTLILIVFSLNVKAATLIFISGRCSAISSVNEGKAGSIYNLIKA